MQTTRIDFILEGREVSVARVRTPGNGPKTRTVQITVAGETHDASVADDAEALTVAKDLVNRATGRHWHATLTGSMLRDVADLLQSVAGW